MPKVVFVEHSGTEHTIDAEEGKSLMQLAVDNMVPGIVADCGGSASCGTCHVYIGEPWRQHLAPPDDTELSMLEGVLHGEADSRLSCQLCLSAALDGVRVRLPRSQM